MVSEKVPLPVRQGLIEISKLSNEQVQQLVSILRETPADQFTSPPKMAAAIRGALKGVDVDAKHLAQAIGSLYIALFESELPREVFADTIVSAMDLVDEKKSFTDRLGALLDIAPISMAFRATVLAESQPNIFASADVVVSVRPLFQANDQPPTHSVLTYTLIIQYQCHDRRELHVGLKEADIRHLREILDGAEKKMASLKSWLQVSDVTNVSLDEKKVEAS